MANCEIEVERGVLTSTYGNIDSRVRMLISFSNALNNNLRMASMKFDSVNFKRASEKVTIMQDKLNQIIAEIHKLKPYLNTLGNIVDDYFRNKY